MNRRAFFTKLGLAAATVAVLPSATTYARRWITQGPLLVPGDYILTSWDIAAGADLLVVHYRILEEALLRIDPILHKKLCHSTSPYPPTVVPS